jgi:ubiquinone/menaquinone biosynthesis C-methylase UbiE
MNPAAVKDDTARRFGWLWAREYADTAQPRWHYDAVKPLLPEGHLTGVVLDAGCGAGHDSIRLAESGECRVIAVELSEEGAAQAARRASARENVSVVRGDLEQLPIHDQACDFVYSYGVLHHLPDPEQGFRELVRVLRPGGAIAIYVYEDFSTRTGAERALLGAVSGMRQLTTRIPRQVLYGMCQVASPLVFATMTLPARGLAKFERTRGLSLRIPFRHGASPMSLTGDLYDRFAAPIERRYSQAEIERWFRQAGLLNILVKPLRGWVGYGVKAGRG